MYRPTKVINIIGAPCSGKTTAAFEKCAELKKQGYSVYYVSEVATDLILAGKQEALKNQKMLFKHQLARQMRAWRKVDYIVTDCPLLLNIVYARFNRVSSPEFEKEVRDANKQFRNEYVYLEHNPMRYSTRNRVHDESQARVIDDIVKDVLAEEDMVHCMQCQRLRNGVIWYGKLHLDICKSCRDRLTGRERE